jgi:hypothetical protein
MGRRMAVWIFDRFGLLRHVHGKARGLEKARNCLAS